LMVCIGCSDSLFDVLKLCRCLFHTLIIPHSADRLPSQKGVISISDCTLSSCLRCWLEGVCSYNRHPYWSVFPLFDVLFL
jgi:hypothetical protein